MSKDLKKVSEPCDYLEEELIQREKEDYKDSAVAVCQGGQWLELCEQRKSDKEVREVLNVELGKGRSVRLCSTLHAIARILTLLQ